MASGVGSQGGFPPQGRVMCSAFQGVLRLPTGDWRWVKELLGGREASLTHRAVGPRQPQRTGPESKPPRSFLKASALLPLGLSLASDQAGPCLGGPGAQMPGEVAAATLSISSTSWGHRVCPVGHLMCLLGATQRDEH